MRRKTARIAGIGGRRWLANLGRGVAAVCVYCFVAVPVLAGPPASFLGSEPVPAHPRRIIVKYRSTVSECAHCLLARGIPFRTVTGTSSLDRLNERFGAQRARSLFFERHGLVGAAASAKYFDRIAAARKPSPIRTARASGRLQPPDLSSVYVLELRRGVDVVRAAQQYAADPAVEYAHPDYEARLAFVPNDPFFSSAGTWGQSYEDMWGLHAIDASTAWDTATGTGTVVAVVDTGVDYNHPDLAANMWTNPGEIAGNGVDDDNNGFIDDVYGWDFRSEDNDPYDLNGHGTHVAGIVAAVGDNGAGVAGVAWGARVMALKGFGPNGPGYISDLAPAIVYAAENGADVINNSWTYFGGHYFGYRTAVTDAVDTALSLGVVVIGAAGNDASNLEWYEPASLPGVIAVSATEPGDTHASFSNSGESLSVAAPGADILSLRGATSGPVGGFIVGGDYLRLWGTSMAAPHVAGLAAVLLSATPGLAPEEVRWHLELNADQPGYPGYEGEAWNPYFGWGRINAARVFDPPPVTTRLKPDHIEFHGFEGETIADVSAAEFVFTTLDPVAWTISAPPWFVPASASGSSTSATTVDFSLDATALAPATYQGTVAVDAPAAVDNGSSLSVVAHVHSENRVGAEIPLTTIDASISRIQAGPKVASNGLVAMAVWSVGTSGADRKATLYGMIIDDGGGTTGPFVLDEQTPNKDNILPDKSWVAVASDGRDFLVVWTDDWYDSWSDRSFAEVNALRVAATGSPLDAAPVLMYSARLGEWSWLHDLSAAYDGNEYVVLWGRGIRTRDRFWVRTLGTDGSLGARRQRVYPRKGTKPYLTLAGLACTTGSCLVAWHEWKDKALRGVRVVNGRPVEKTAVHIASNVDIARSVASDGTDFMAIGFRGLFCQPGEGCEREVVGARVTAGGISLDPDGITLNKAGVQEFVYRSPWDVAFDGTAYTTVFQVSGPPNTAGGAMTTGNYLFAARVAPDGTALGSEPEGFLVRSRPVAYAAAVSPLPTSSLIAWKDRRFDDPMTASSLYSSLFSQRVFGHPAASEFVPAAIGSIGSQSVTEGEVLALALSAPGLDPSATVFSASSLPPGAGFDATSGLLRWKPASDEAGVYAGVHFEATDGTTTVGEDVTLTVTEAQLSISGTARFQDGTLAERVALKLTGTRPSRKLLTDANGAFRVDVPGAKEYRLRIGRPSSKLYRLNPRTVKVTVAGSDVRGLDLVVSAK